MPASFALHRKMMRLAAAFGHNHSAVLSWLKHSCQKQGCRLELHPYVWALRKEGRVIRFAPRHYANIPHIAARFDVYFASLIPEVRGQEQILDFSRVHLATYKKPGLTFEFNGCPDEVDVLDSYLGVFKPARDEIAFDIGARCGVFTYILSKLAGEVIAFEQDPVAMAVLERNKDRHQLHNVTLVKELPNLGDAFVRWGIPSYCKIEAAGAEIEMLEAARSVLPDYDTHFAVRTLHAALGLSTQRQVQRILRRCGFQTSSDVSLGVTCGRPT